MPFTLSELHTWMNAAEDEHFEFKEAIHTLGKTREARWFPSPASNPEKPNS